MGRSPPNRHVKYCPECTSVLEAKFIDGVERKACSSRDCGFVHWGNPCPVVAALVEYQDKMILARNARWPDGVLSLITGYLERNETLEQAVMREIKEELGLDSKLIRFIGCYSLFEKNQVILAHWVLATGELAPGSELSDVQLLSRQELASWEFGPLTLTSEIVRDWLENEDA